MPVFQINDPEARALVIHLKCFVELINLIKRGRRNVHDYIVLLHGFLHVVMPAKHGNGVGVLEKGRLHGFPVAQRIIRIHVRYAALQWRMVHKQDHFLLRAAELILEPLSLEQRHFAGGRIEEQHRPAAQRFGKIKLPHVQVAQLFKGLCHLYRIVVIPRDIVIRYAQAVELRLYPKVNTGIAMAETKIAGEHQMIRLELTDGFQYVQEIGAHVHAEGIFTVFPEVGIGDVYDSHSWVF